MKYRIDSTYLVRVDPETFVITPTGLRFLEGPVISSALIGDTYYLSTARGGVFDYESKQLAIDLNLNKISEIQPSSGFFAPILTSSDSEGKLFGLADKMITGGTNKTVPVNFDLDNGITEIATNLPLNYRLEIGL